LHVGLAGFFRQPGLHAEDSGEAEQVYEGFAVEIIEDLGNEHVFRGFPVRAVKPKLTDAASIIAIPADQ
jgi:hypothetical protein